MKECLKNERKLKNSKSLYNKVSEKVKPIRKPLGLSLILCEFFCRQAFWMLKIQRLSYDVSDWNYDKIVYHSVNGFEICLYE